MTNLASNPKVPNRSLGQEGNYLVPLFTTKQRRIYDAGCLAWSASLLWFWIWWLSPDHMLDAFWYGALSIVLAWLTLLPAYFLVIFRGSCSPREDLSPPPNARIAMVVTMAPSEPFYVVQKTLRAMLGQRLPEGTRHDVWLAAEAPDRYVLEWCRQNRVQVSTRKDVAAYHRSSWPRRTRCKEGNLAYFYDHYGYENYDFVSQLDADHVPDPYYLWHMLAAFNDPQVGYVTAPSICDANAADSWSARSRLYAEGPLHGALQAGYNNGWAPLCIGSHYAVRTNALQEVGGLGPELAEDHSTTLIFNSAGWRGVHAMDAIAHGDGPATFADLATQEFQWSRSLVTILLRYSAGYVPTLSSRLKFQFLFSQLWYPLFSGFMAFMFLLPIIALLRAEPFVGVTYPEFLLHFVPMSCVLIVLAVFWRRQGWLRPMSARIVSWEASIFLLARWPWALAGSLAAVWDRLSSGFVDFKVTPKGTAAEQVVPWKVMSPYLILSAISTLAVIVAERESQASGFLLFAGVNAITYATIAAVIAIQHCRENGIKSTRFLLRHPVQIAAILLALTSPALTLGDKGLYAIEALSVGAEPLKLTRTTYNAAGAGMGRSGVRHLSLTFEWELGNKPSMEEQRPDREEQISDVRHKGGGQ